MTIRDTWCVMCARIIRRQLTIQEIVEGVVVEAAPLPIVCKKCYFKMMRKGSR